MSSVSSLYAPEGKHTLLLQVGLVDTSERAGDNGATAEETGLESGVLTTRAFAIVVDVSDTKLDACERKGVRGKE